MGPEGNSTVCACMGACVGVCRRTSECVCVCARMHAHMRASQRDEELIYQANIRFPLATLQPDEDRLTLCLLTHKNTFWEEKTPV